jgi:hypothetical protein
MAGWFLTNRETDVSFCLGAPMGQMELLHSGGRIFTLPKDLINILTDMHVVKVCSNPVWMCTLLASLGTNTRGCMHLGDALAHYKVPYKETVIPGSKWYRVHKEDDHFWSLELITPLELCYALSKDLCGLEDGPCP